MAQKINTRRVNNFQRKQPAKILKQIDELVEMGFPIKRARIAFQQTNDVAQAAELLAIDQEERSDQEPSYNSEHGSVQDSRSQSSGFDVGH